MYHLLPLDLPLLAVLPAVLPAMLLAIVPSNRSLSVQLFSVATDGRIDAARVASVHVYVGCQREARLLRLNGITSNLSLA